MGSSKGTLSTPSGCRACLSLLGSGGRSSESPGMVMSSERSSDTTTLSLGCESTQSLHFSNSGPCAGACRCTWERAEVHGKVGKRERAQVNADSVEERGRAQSH